MAVFKCAGGTDGSRQELRAHGTEEYPIGCYGDDLASEPVPIHWHEELEAGVVWYGTAEVEFGGMVHSISAGDGFFLYGGALHAARAAAPCQIRSLVFHPRLLGSMDSRFGQQYLIPITSDERIGGLVLRQAVSWQRTAIRYLESAWDACAEEPRDYVLSVREDLSRLIAAVLRGSPGTMPGTAREKTRILQMLRYLEAHYPEPLTLSGIAASAAVSESECLRSFRRAAGISPMQYLSQLRLRRAAELLRATEWSMAEIGARCGFQDMSYFAKRFRQWKGCTPSQYRKNQ